MKTIFRIIPILFLFLSLIPNYTYTQPIRRSTLNVANTWAVVIGISEYNSSEIPALRFAAADAKAFYNYLRDPMGMNVPENNIILLLNQNATSENIKSSLGDFMAKNVKPEDTLIFYFAGHGGNEVDFIQKGSSITEKYLISHDGSLDNFYSTCINMRDDLGYIFSNRISAKAIICLLDCCYSGGAGLGSARAVAGSGSKFLISRGVKITPKLKGFKSFTKREGLVTITSSLPSQISTESTEFRHGVFTYFTIKALSGEADFNKNKLVTLAEYYDYIKNAVSKYTAGKQEPCLFGESYQSLVLSKPKGKVIAFKNYTHSITQRWEPIPSKETKVEYKQWLSMETDYFAQIKREGNKLFIAVISNPGETSDMLEALADARQKQREQVRKYLGGSFAEAERFYETGEIVDAREFDNKTWYLLNQYRLN